MVKNYAEHIVKGSAYIFIISLITNFIGYLIRIYLARALTPAEYGLIYATLSILGIANILRNLGMPDTLRKKIPEFLVKNNYIRIKSTMVFAFAIEFIYTSIIVIIIFMFSDAIAANVLKTASGVPLLLILCLSTLITVVYQIINSSFQGLQKFKIYTATDLSTYVLRLLLIVAFTTPFGIMALPYAYLLTSIIMSVVVYIILRAKFSIIIKAKISINKNLSKEILYFSTPMMISYTASTIVTNLDTILLSFFKTAQDVALYQIALPLANLMLLISSAITVVLLPTVSELWTKKKYDTIGHMIGLVSKALFIIMIPLAMMMIAFPENVISMLFGEIYNPAAPVLQMLALAMLVISMNSVFTSSFIGIGKPGLVTKITFISMAFNVVFNFSLIPFLGIYGAAASLIVSSIVGFILLAFYLRKYTKFRIQWLNIGKILFDGIISIAIIFAIKTILVTNPWIELVVSLIISALFYSIFILYTKSITFEELDILKKMNTPIPKFLFRFSKKILDRKTHF